MAEGNTGVLATIEDLEPLLEIVHAQIVRASKLTRRATILLLNPERSEADIAEALKACATATEALGGSLE